MSHLRSMTAFARISQQSEQGTLTLEIQSVNRRFLELNFQLPRSFSPYETLLRKQLSAQVGRGALTIRAIFVPHSDTTREVIPNLPFAKGLKKAWGQIQKELALPGEITLELLSVYKDELFRYHEEGEENHYGPFLTQVMAELVRQFIQMKEIEGERLAEDLLLRIKNLEEFLNQIEWQAPIAVETYRLKLQERIAAVLSQPVEDERILKEIALYADRIDITEEIVRLRSHFLQIKALIAARFTDLLDTKGKKIEFLTQEMLREINTIGSKSTNEKVIHLVVQSKAELEKIKEQCQNIE